jgi:hypothetical protein
MWFKTRVGLSNCSESFEIRPFRTEKTGKWGIAAVSRCGPDFETRSFGRTHRVTSPWYQLAYFKDGPDVQQEIAAAMTYIVEAIEAKAVVCDLSGVGSADAWDKQWPQVAWR